MDIRTDERNARIHDQNNKDSIRTSLKELGTGRSILIDANNVIIGGNGVYAEAMKLELPVKVIESDGTELIAIKRTDLSTDDAKRKALAIADNRTTDLSFFDDSRLAEIFMELDTFSGAVGFTEAEINALLEPENVLDDLIENNFSNSIRKGSDVFAVTFIFPKAEELKIVSYIRKHGKSVVADKIIAMCKEAE